MTRWFFVHMMKTGGTSLFFMLQRQIARRDIFPPPHENIGNLSYDASAALVEINNPDSSYSMISGHYPLSCIDHAPGEWKTFTLLRHPVQRTLSALRKQSDRAPGTTVESIYDDPILFGMWFDNYMVKVLGLGQEELGGGIISSERRHLDRALEALEELDVIGVSEDFNPFVNRLEERFDWNLGERLEINRTASDFDLPQSLVERVCEDNRLDLELYDRARKLLDLPALDELGRPLAATP